MIFYFVSRIKLYKIGASRLVNYLLVFGLSSLPGIAIIIMIFNISNELIPLFQAVSVISLILFIIRVVMAFTIPGEVGKVNISQATYELIKDDPQFVFEHRGKISAKGKGEVDMWFVSLT